MSKPLIAHDVEKSVRIFLVPDVAHCFSTNGDSNAIQGLVFLSRHARLSDLLNDQRAFLPVKVGERLLIINKVAIALIEEIE
jgi:hypothetical protein